MDKANTFQNRTFEKAFTKGLCNLIKDLDDQKFRKVQAVVQKEGLKRTFAELKRLGIEPEW